MEDFGEAMTPELREQEKSQLKRAEENKNEVEGKERHPCDSCCW